MKKTAASKAGAKLHFEPVTKDRWDDLAKLFGERGACAGCWCMYWRCSRKEFVAGKGDGNKKAFRKLIKSGQVPGILAYDGAIPIGWCSVAPRETFVRLEKSRSFAPLDDQPVWSVSCLFVNPAYRRAGVSVAMLRAAQDYARSQGGIVIEGYPSITTKKLPDPWVWTGVLPAYIKAGFKEAKRPSASRAIVRKKL